MGASTGFSARASQPKVRPFARHLIVEVVRDLHQHLRGTDVHMAVEEVASHLQFTVLLTAQNGSTKNTKEPERAHVPNNCRIDGNHQMKTAGHHHAVIVRQRSRVYQAAATTSIILRTFKVGIDQSVGFCTCAYEIFLRVHFHFRMIISCQQISDKEQEPTQQISLRSMWSDPPASHNNNKAQDPARR